MILYINLIKINNHLTGLPLPFRAGQRCGHADVGTHGSGRENLQRLNQGAI